MLCELKRSRLYKYLASQDLFMMINMLALQITSYTESNHFLVLGATLQIKT